MYAAPAQGKPELTGDAQVDRLRALWKSGQDKFHAFYATLNAVRQQVGDDKLADWCLDNCGIGMSRITQVADVLKKDDAARVKEELKAAKAHARQQRRSK
jgi:hypothetical protein